MSKRIPILFAAIFFPVAAISQIREEYQPLARILYTAPGREPTDGNLVEIIPGSPKVFVRLQEEIMDAHESVHAEYFIFDSDEAGFWFRTALALKARQGVEVQYLAEDFTQQPRFINSMKSSGVEVRHHPMLPLKRRNHQKFLLIDGEVGYTGGMNVAVDNICEWEDIVVRLRGPVVASMETEYAKIWERHGGSPSAFEIKKIHPYEEGITVQSVDEDIREKGHLNLQAYLWALDNAKDYFYAKTPYLKPPKELVKALKDAAARGVDVRIMIPSHKDSPATVLVPFERSYYYELVKAGVHIYLREDMFDHSKVFVCDDYLSALGSINLDALSMYYNYENNLYFYDESTAALLKLSIEEDFGNCIELTERQIDEFPAWQKNFNWMFRMLSHLF